MAPKKKRNLARASKVSSIFEEVVDSVEEQKFREITIQLENYQCVTPVYPIADIQTTVLYEENILGITNLVPLTDQDIIPISESFSFTIDVNNPNEIDRLISSPAFIVVNQFRGSMDSSFYPLLQCNSKIHMIPPIKSFESVFSVYEAITDKKVEISMSKLKRYSKSGKTAHPETNVSNDVKQMYSESTDFGMCCLDFLPLSYGKKSFTQTLLIKPITQHKDDKMISFKAHPKIQVTVSVDADLDLADPIFLNFTLETIYNLPDVMSTDMDYWACTMLPMLNGSKTPLIFKNPTMLSHTKGGIAKLWPGTTRIYGDGNATLYTTPIGTKDIISQCDDPNIENYIIEETPRLEFVMIKRHIMCKDALDELKHHIITYRKIVLEFYITPGEKNKTTSTTVTLKPTDFSTKRKTTSQFLHLMAIVDVGVLLYPGVKYLRVAVPIKTFSFEEAVKLGGMEDSFFFPVSKKEVKENDISLRKEKSSVPSLYKSKHNLRDRLPSKPVFPPEPEPSQQVFNEEGKPCFVLITIELSNELIHKRNIEDLKEELSLLLKENKIGLDHKYLLPPYMSLDYFQEVLGAMINDLNQKFSVFKIESPRQSEFEPSSQIAHRFLNFLKCEGIYESYISAMTKATTLVVSQQFKSIDYSECFQKLLGDLFVFLISTMNITINKLICHSLEPVTTLKEIDEFFFYAREAMATERLDMAERYILEKLCNDTCNADNWFDYGIFLLEQEKSDMAYECMREALLQGQHKYSLLVLAVLLCNKGQPEDSETCFLNLMVEEETWAEGWAILYLFYQKINYNVGMDKAYASVIKYRDHHSKSDYFADFDDLIWTSKICPKTVFFRAAMLLLKLRLYDWSELALSQEINAEPGFVHYLLSAICYYKKLYSHALDHIEEAMKHYGPDYAVSSLNAHCLFALDRIEEAKQHYYFALEFYNRPVHMHLVSLNLVRICESIGNFQEARKMALLVCKHSPSPYTWLLAGKLYYYENDFLSAEECFSEGNMLDNKYAEIWGYLALVNYKLERTVEAKLCFDQAMKNLLCDDHLVQLLNSEQDLRASTASYTC